MAGEFYNLHRRDWAFIDDVRNGGFRYSPDRDVVGLPVAPSTGVRIKIHNPTQNQIAVAASSFGYRSTDRSFVVWTDTLREVPEDQQTKRILPLENDKLIVDGAEWIIRSVKSTVFDTQYICYCQESQFTEKRDAGY